MKYASLVIDTELPLWQTSLFSSLVQLGDIPATSFLNDRAEYEELDVD